MSTAWSVQPVTPGDQAALAVVLDIVPPYHANPDASQIPPDLKYLIPTALRVTNVPPAWLTVGPVQYPRAHEVPVQFTGKPQTILAYDGRTVLYLPVTVSAVAPSGQATLELSLTYQVCDEMTCLPPRTRTLTATLTVGSVQERTVSNEPELFAGFDHTVFASGGAFGGASGGASGGGGGGGTLPGVRLDVFGWGIDVNPRGLGLALLLGMAALGGFLLNLTPCVLPVIPIKVLSLSQSAGHRARCLALGLTMSLGVVLFWLALGLAIAFVSGFAAINQLFQQPWFTLGVGVVIAAMAVGMCGLFALRLPRFVYSISPRHDTLTGSVGFGVMTAVLSTPCTAPFMGAAAAWAATQQPGVTLATFSSIGAGMALPYLVLSALPKLVEKVPRTGPGSELLKQVMGLLMLAAAAYFFGVGVSGLLTEPADPPPLGHWWPVAGAIAAAGAWLAWRILVITRSTLKRAVFVTLGLVMIVGSIAAGRHLTDRGPINWVYYTPQRFEQALAAGNVIVMDFTAEWCLNCKAIEASVLHNQRVVEALRLPGVKPMKVDLTGPNPDGAAKLQSVGGVAIPLLVVFAPDGREVFKSSFYTVEEVLTAVAWAGGLRDDDRR